MKIKRQLFAMSKKCRMFVGQICYTKLLNKMKLTTKAVEKVKHSLDCRNRLAFEMKKSGRTIERLLKDNETDGDLTKAKAVEIISEETGLKQNLILSE